VLVPDRKIALEKIRAAVDDLLADAEDGAKSHSQLTWIAAALDQLLHLEDRGFYTAHLQAGLALAKAGAALTGDKTAPAENIAAVQNHLAEITKTLARHPGDAAFAWLNQVTDWENALYARLVPAPRAAPPTNPGFTPDRLQTYLRARSGNPTLTVTGLKTLHGGYSKQTILFTTQDDTHGPQSLVIRAEKKSTIVLLAATDIAREFAAVKYYHKSGLPVAAPLFLEPDAAHFGDRFMVSRQVPGKIFGHGVADMSTLPRDMQVSLLTTLAQIHRLQPDLTDPDVQNSHLPAWTAYPTIQANTAAWVTFWKQQLDKAGCPTTPIIERVYAWLLDNIPREDIAPVILHGDYGLANILLDAGKVTAVLDWELGFFGDPGYDFPNFMHEYNPALLEIYEQAGGQHISEFRFMYYAIFKVFKSIPMILGLHRLQTDPAAPLNFHLLASFANYMTPPLNALLETARTMKN
jgi:aminoglycoside phosphotransferase (APT) family kinase protein